MDILLSDLRSGAARYRTIQVGHEASFAGVCDLSEIQHRRSADMDSCCVAGSGVWDLETKLSVAF
jgi:hypothetical protein